MNLNNLETGLASYLDTEPLTTLAEIREGVSDATYPQKGPVVMTMADGAPVVVGNLYTGQIRIRVRTPKTKDGKQAHTDSMDAVDDLFPAQGSAGYAAAKAAISAALVIEDNVECNGYSKAEGGWVDAEEEIHWQTDLGLKMGLKDLDEV